jgi:hypothetical protein
MAAAEAPPIGAQATPIAPFEQAVSLWGSRRPSLAGPFLSVGDESHLVIGARLVHDRGDTYTLVEKAVPSPGADTGGELGAGSHNPLRPNGFPIWLLTGLAVLCILASACRSASLSAASATGLTATSAASPSGGPSRGSSETPGGWRLEFERSGGLAGEMQSIVLDRDGSFVATDMRRNVRKEGTLGEQDVRRIGEMLDGLYPFPEGPRGDGCNDCFVYTIRLDFAGRPVAISLDDTELPGSPYQGLVGALNTLMSEDLADG